MQRYNAMPTFAVAVPHAPWMPGRVASAQRLCRQLAIEPHCLRHDCIRHFRVFSELESNRSWSERTWSWGAQGSASHFVLIQDDVEAAPDFWSHLHAMVAAKPLDVIGLQTVHPLARDGEGRWCSTADGLVGCGYVLPVVLLRAFLEWRSHALHAGALDSITEDSLLSLWCLVEGHKVLHPLPTIIRHDTALPSSYGNDAHGLRDTAVTWRERALPAPTRENWDQPVAHLGFFYGGRIGMLGRRWLIGATDADWRTWIDRGQTP